MNHLWKSSKDVRKEKASRLRHLRVYANTSGGVSILHHDTGDDEATESHEFSDAKSALRHLSAVVSDHFVADADHDEAENGAEYKSDSEFSNQDISSSLRSALRDEVRTALAVRKKHDRQSEKVEKKHQIVFNR